MILINFFWIECGSVCITGVVLNEMEGKRIRDATDKKQHNLLQKEAGK